MAEAEISVAEIENYKTYVGRAMIETDTVGAHVPLRMAATLDQSSPPRTCIPKTSSSDDFVIVKLRVLQELPG